jgi:hypothetical protein
MMAMYSVKTRATVMIPTPLLTLMLQMFAVMGSTRIATPMTQYVKEAVVGGEVVLLAPWCQVYS